MRNKLLTGSAYVIGYLGVTYVFIELWMNVHWSASLLLTLFWINMHINMYLSKVQNKRVEGLYQSLERVLSIVERLTKPKGKH